MFNFKSFRSSKYYENLVREKSARCLTFIPNFKFFRSGKYCEKELSKVDLNVAGFTGSSYVELKPLHRSLTR